jgi:predicted nucleic acid-binding protein
MGLILDTSLLVADERGKFEMTSFLRQFAREQPMITAITASELLHGVERTADAARRTKRQRHVEQILATVPVQSSIAAQRFAGNIMKSPFTCAGVVLVTQRCQPPAGNKSLTVHST